MDEPAARKLGRTTKKRQQAAAIQTDATLYRAILADSQKMSSAIKQARKIVAAVGTMQAAEAK
jgi:hypothetical protein